MGVSDDVCERFDVEKRVSDWCQMRCRIGVRCVVGCVSDRCVEWVSDRCVGCLFGSEPISLHVAVEFPFSSWREDLVRESGSLGVVGLF